MPFTPGTLLDIDALSRHVCRIRQGTRPLIGIDGPGGAGKSTLAQHLVATMGNTSLVHVDDFYLPAKETLNFRIVSYREQELGPPLHNSRKPHLEP